LHGNVNRLVLGGLACLACLGGWGAALATTKSPVRVDEQAIAQCVADASTRHGVNPDLLLAILKVESNLRADPVRRNANGSIDVGIAQINSIHFPELQRHGVQWQHLLQPCVGIHVAAWHLKNQILRHGNTWFAVGAYHSVTPSFNQAYQGRVMRELKRRGKLPP